MDDTQQQVFTLHGGPLHRVGTTLGLVRDKTNPTLFGFAIGGSLWVVLVLLAFFEGAISQAFSIQVIGAHSRLLVVIPLFFFCEAILNPRLATFVDTLIKSEVVPQTSLNQLNAIIQRTMGVNKSWLPDALCLVAAVTFAWVTPSIPYLGTTAKDGNLNLTEVMPLATEWYLTVCLTVFRFLMFRWVWRLGLWIFFLWKLSKLRLHLVPTHPDGVAGLGYLEVVHAHFSPLVIAISVIQGAALAEEIVSGNAAVEIIYPAVGFILITDTLLFLAPLLIFSGELWRTRIRALSEYMEFSSSYVTKFDKKWLRSEQPSNEPLLGTPDIQSLADLASSMSVVREMRWIPISLNLARDLALAALIPLLPLLLLKYPFTELMHAFFSRLTGL